MGPEIWVGLVAVFVSGGAIGSAGTLLAQWLVRKVDSDAGDRRGLADAERAALRSELDEIHRHMHNVDARLDFTERLLDGALPLARPPQPLHGRGPTDDDGAPGSEPDA